MSEPSSRRADRVIVIMSRGEIEGFDPGLPIDKAHTPPYTWYTDPDIFEAEKHCVFEKSWIAVGRTGQVVAGGDYFTGQIAGNPYVIVRGDDGLLRAFHNVCRHHAAEVAQECGSCRELVCPYHGWMDRCGALPGWAGWRTLIRTTSDSLR